MDKYKIIQVKESVFADNDREAGRARQQLKKQGTFLLNLMSSPGSGKTTTLLRTGGRPEGSAAHGRYGGGHRLRRGRRRHGQRRGPVRSSCTPAACATWTQG